MFDIDDPHLAAVAWSRLTEPGDLIAGALVQELGASEALRWLLEIRGANGESTDWSLPTGNGSQISTLSSDSVKEAVYTGEGDGRTRLLAAAEGWLPRVANLDPARDLDEGHRVGAELLLPDDSRWPHQFSDLGAAEPFALWVRGDPQLSERAERSVALVGARASTHYGEQVAVEMASGLTDRRFAIVSGGAYGIDAAAHRGTLASGGFTVAFLACGIDQMYPPGNTGLLRAVAETGTIISEVPPGSPPYRSRFLARNRLIAALAGATVVVEAAWRSGALSTARHAASLLRPVGAVPGSVSSMASGGCHQLIRDGIATLVTDAAEVAELAGCHGTDIAPQRRGEEGLCDRLTPEQKRVYAVLPLRGYSEPTRLSELAGTSLTVTLAALGILELTGQAKSNGSGWKRATPAE